jgi:Papain-like cysteine protease AvrRpt2
MWALNNFRVAQQAVENSCWAAAARSIVNWYHGCAQAGPNPVYASDQELATAWALASGDQTNADINMQQSASAALAALGFINNTDAVALPTPGEIADAINSGIPLLAIIGTTVPDPNPDTGCQDGHWMVIVGITSTQQDADLLVFDPNDGQIHTAPYNVSTYQAGSYWQNTSYVDPYFVAARAQAPGLMAAPPRLAAPVTPPVNSWMAEARNGVTLRVEWPPLDGDSSVNVTVTQSAGPGADNVGKTAKLGTPPECASQGIWKFGTPATPVELTLTLRIVPAGQAGERARGQLWAAYPLKQAEGANRVIATWPLGVASN